MPQTRLKARQFTPWLPRAVRTLDSESVSVSVELLKVRNRIEISGVFVAGEIPVKPNIVLHPHDLQNMIICAA